jgi:hypothetical protein
METEGVPSESQVPSRSPPVPHPPAVDEMMVHFLTLIIAF